MKNTFNVNMQLFVFNILLMDILFLKEEREKLFNDLTIMH